MTVEELREKLSKFPDDMLVVASQDEEGNGFRKVYSVDSGYRYIEEDKDIIEDDDCDNPEFEKCVVIWP